MKRAVALCLALLAASPAGAQGRDCSGLATQMEINTCLSENFGAWQDEMERHYAAALARLGEEDEARMRAGQLAFVTYRDMVCEVEAGMMRGGSGEPMMRLDCLGRLTERRARDLQTFVGWFQ